MYCACLYYRSVIGPLSRAMLDDVVRPVFGVLVFTTFVESTGEDKEWCDG